MSRVAGALKPRDLPEFKWTSTVQGNLKTMMSGAFKALKYRKYAQTYLGAFAYRLAASNLKCNTPPRVRCTDAYQYDIPTASA
jgi:hypothetical protein